MQILVYITIFAFAAIAYVAAHEGGHYLSAAACRLNPRFFFAWDVWEIAGCEVKTPMFGVKHDDTDKDWQNRLIGNMGFGGAAWVGFLLIVLQWKLSPFLSKYALFRWFDWSFLISYALVFCGHHFIYPFKKKGSPTNDYNRTDADEDPMT